MSSASTTANAIPTATVYPRLGVAIDKPKTTLLALALACVMAITGCWFNPAWLQDALNDLPVLVQMALSIAQIIAVTKSGTAPSSAEIAAINQISSVADQGLLAIQALYKSYTSANSTTTIADIKAAGNALVTNLNQLLQAAQIKDTALLARVTSAVNLIVSTVNTILGLLPASASASDVRLANRTAKSTTVPKPDDLRTAWQQQVGFALAK